MSKIVNNQSVSDRIQKVFKEQEAQMKARALKPHEIDCDIDFCQKEICWKWEPDKIVSEPYEVSEVGEPIKSFQMAPILEEAFLEIQARAEVLEKIIRWLSDKFNIPVDEEFFE